MFKNFFKKKEVRKEKTFDASIPRWMYWNDDIDFVGKCPKCDTSLEREYCTYLFFTREEGEVVTFIMGNDGGNFCSQCSVIVLDKDIFAETAMAGGASPGAFTVVGIVDFKAIPEEKRHVPLGEDGNPIPLVEFLNNGKNGPNKRRFIGQNKKRRSKTRKKNKKRR